MSFGLCCCKDATIVCKAQTCLDFLLLSAAQPFAAPSPSAPPFPLCQGHGHASKPSSVCHMCLCSPCASDAWLTLAKCHLYVTVLCTNEDSVCAHHSATHVSWLGNMASIHAGLAALAPAARAQTLQTEFTDACFTLWATQCNSKHQPLHTQLQPTSLGCLMQHLPMTTMGHDTGHIPKLHRMVTQL